MWARDELRQLAADAKVHGHESLGTSVLGLADALDAASPELLGALHHAWVDALRPYAGLLRTLGEADGRHEHDAFHAAVCLRAVRAVEERFREATGSSASLEPR